LKIAVFVSGRGSNLQAILNSVDIKDLIEVKAVVSDKTDCAAFKIAETAQGGAIPTFSVGYKDGCISYQHLSDLFVQLKIDLIVLAGFLKLIPADFLKQFEGKIINIHPALLPCFGGKGMYGLNVHKAVFESSAKVSGPSVHFVDEAYDRGKIIAQRCVDISDLNSPEEIAERVLKEEHKLLPFVLKKFAENKIKIESGRVTII
jgi:formyltetrahydrofolate-dependent phosphoribosylglycinamide formyltransferase